MFKLLCEYSLRSWRFDFYYYFIIIIIFGLVFSVVEK